MQRPSSKTLSCTNSRHATGVNRSGRAPRPIPRGKPGSCAARHMDRWAQKRPSLLSRRQYLPILEPIGSVLSPSGSQFDLRYVRIRHRRRVERASTDTAGTGTPAPPPAPPPAQSYAVDVSNSDTPRRASLTKRVARGPSLRRRACRRFACTWTVSRPIGLRAGEDGE